MKQVSQPDKGLETLTPAFEEIVSHAHSDGDYPEKLVYEENRP